MNGGYKMNKLFTAIGSLLIASTGIAMQQPNAPITNSRNRPYDILELKFSMNKKETDLREQIDLLSDLKDLSAIKDKLNEITQEMYRTEKVFVDDLYEHTLNNLVTKFQFHKGARATISKFARTLSNSGAHDWLRNNAPEDALKDEINKVHSTDNLLVIKQRLDQIMHQRYRSESKFVDDVYEHTLNNLVAKFGQDKKEAIAQFASTLQAPGAYRWLRNNKMVKP